MKHVNVRYHVHTYVPCTVHADEETYGQAGEAIENDDTKLKIHPIRFLRWVTLDSNPAQVP